MKKGEEWGESAGEMRREQDQMRMRLRPLSC